MFSILCGFRLNFADAIRVLNVYLCVSFFFLSHLPFAMKRFSYTRIRFNDYLSELYLLFVTGPAKLFVELCEDYLLKW